MCKDCLHEVRPDMQNNATDSGANMINYKGCIQCGTITFLIKEVVSQDIMSEDGEDGDAFEELRFKHICSICQHVVAEHFYTYIQDHEEQSYNMDCFLCGKGGYTVEFNEIFQVLKDNDQILAATNDSETKVLPPPKETNFSAALMSAKFTPQDDDKTNPEDDAEWE